MRSYSPGPVLVSLIPFSLFCCCVDFVAAICYYPDRSLSPQDVPCSDSEGESNCCGPGYACLSNKVCRQAHRDDNGNIIKYTYGRGSCTDRNWRSSACPSFCILGLSGVANCDQSQTVESSYCCADINGKLTQDGVNGICNCSANGGLTQPLHFESNASAITTIDEVASSSQSSLSTRTALTKTSSSVRAFSSVSTAPTSTTSVESTHFSTYFSTSTETSLTASPSLLPSIQSSIQPSNKRAVAVGAGIGTALALIVLGFAAFFLYRKISHPSHEKKRHETGLSLNRDSSVPLSYHYQCVGPSEVLASIGAHEMPAAPGRYELPGDS